VPPRRSGGPVWALAALLLLGWSVAGPSLAGAVPSLDEAVQSIETAYRRVTDLRASFQQTAVNRTLNQTLEAKGTLYLKKPGKLRWEYTTPTPQEIVSDAKRLWVYTPELRQVNVSDAPAALAGPAGSFLQGLGQVREHFQARFLNPAQPTDPIGQLVLDLTPKEPQPLMARLIVAVDPKSWLVRAAVVYDELGNTVTVRFGEPVVNSGLADALFVFTPPPGVVVVPAPGLGKP
jgi:outer membrane lipoprotein carrier protein